MKDNLELIKDACIKANPEIMELKFGCNVLFKNNFANYEGIFAGKHKGKFLFYYQFGIKDGELGKHFADKEDDFEILGRPIRLADVLFAIKKNRHSVDDLAGMKELFGKIACKWVGVFAKEDNLEHQSEETINFIASLL